MAARDQHGTGAATKRVAAHGDIGERLGHLPQRAGEVSFPDQAAKAVIVQRPHGVLAT